jgi:hypothetical protein
MSTKITSIEDVRGYLGSCDPNKLKVYLQILGISKMHKPSTPYVCKQVEIKIDPNSPVVKFLKERNSESAWAELTKTVEDIATENGLNTSLYSKR